MNKIKADGARFFFGLPFSFLVAALRFVPVVALVVEPFLALLLTDFRASGQNISPIVRSKTHDHLLFSDQIIPRHLSIQPQSNSSFVQQGVQISVFSKFFKCFLISIFFPGPKGNPSKPSNTSSVPVNFSNCSRKYG